MESRWLLQQPAGPRGPPPGGWRFRRCV